MTRQHVLVALGLSTLALLVIGATRTWSAVRSFDGDLPPAAAPPVILGQTDLEPDDNMRQRMRSIVAADVFRLARRPADVPYGSASLVASAPPPPPRPAKPTLAVSGILGGPPWEALLDGVPGANAAVLVREGDTLGVLRVRRVMRDSVIVSDADTTWRLALKRAWQ